MHGVSKAMPAAAVAGLAVALVGAPAIASGGTQPQNFPGGGGSNCQDGTPVDCLYHLEGRTGARVQLTGFSSCYDYCGSNLVFNDSTEGSGGLNAAIRNNAESVYNNDSSTTLLIYVSPNHVGYSDWFNYDGGLNEYGDGAGWYGNLDLTLKNGASQQWGLGPQD